MADKFELAAVARPGDTVLIGFAHSLTDEDIEALDESFRPLIDQGIKVGFMDNVTSMVVFRPDEEVDDDAFLPVWGAATLEGHEEPGER